jgi:protease-4
MSGLLAITVLGVSVTIALVAQHDDWENDLNTGGAKVGVVEILGPIVGSKEVLDQLKIYRENDSVKAVILRIDSPGGAVGPAQEIYREVQKTTETKKVIASMGSVAASGGYYIAAAADGIMANPGTVTGSIGVIMSYTNMEELFRKIGLSPVVIKSGKYKDTGSPGRPMTPEEETLLGKLAEDIHSQFIKDVAHARNLEVEQVQSAADGRIYTGHQAKNLGLVDRMGNFADAVAWAGELGGIEGEVETVYPPEEKLELWQYLMETTSQALSKMLIQSTLKADYRLSAPTPK